MQCASEISSTSCAFDCGRSEARAVSGYHSGRGGKNEANEPIAATDRAPDVAVRDILKCVHLYVAVANDGKQVAPGLVPGPFAVGVVIQLTRKNAFLGPGRAEQGEFLIEHVVDCRR